MNYIKNAIGHFKTIMIHKYWVYKYAKQIGIPCQGLLHDLSKFSWVEFSESVKFYQEGKSSPIVAAKKAQGYSLAWQHHKGRNPHHYEHWTDKYDDGTIALKMPFKYALELIADYLGAGRAYQGKSFTPEAEYKWWKNHIDTKDIMMHEETKYFVSWVLLLINLPNSASFSLLSPSVVPGRRFSLGGSIFVGAELPLSS